MKLSDLAHAQKLLAELQPLKEQYSICNDAWGDWWYASYDYADRGENKKGRFRIPMTLVRDELSRQMAVFEEKLTALGLDIYA